MADHISADEHAYQAHLTEQVNQTQAAFEQAQAAFFQAKAAVESFGSFLVTKYGLKPGDSLTAAGDIVRAEATKPAEGEAA